MKITVFISALSGGGAERVACNLANYLCDFGHGVEILTIGDSTSAEPLRDAIRYSPLLAKEEKRNALLDGVRRIVRLRRYMRTQKVDAYVVMLPVPILMTLGMSRLTKAPIVVSERGDPEKNTKTMKKLLRRWICRANRVVFQTETAKSWYEPYLKGAEAAVIPNAINPVFIRPKFEGEREKTIVAAGRFAVQKNFPLLIRAFSKVAAKFPEYRLVIYGKGSLLASYQDLAKELGVDDRVEFPGYVPDMPARLERAGMFVLSSNHEGMPNALMEAMASGLPCVSTDCSGGGARFLIRDGENGLLVPIGDEEALADAMEKVLSDEALAATLGNNARKLQETLAPEKIYGEWEAFIQKCGGRNKT